MNALKTILIFSFFVTTSIVGCSKDDNSNNNSPVTQCDQFGNCYNVNNPFGNNSIYGNPNEVILSGAISVQNSKNWKLALDGITNCKNQHFFGLGYCNRINSAPRINATFSDYKFTNGSSAGTLGIGNQFIPVQNYPVTWRQITLSTGEVGYEAQLLTPFEFRGRPLRLQLFGLSTDAVLSAVLYYGHPNIQNDSSTIIGTGSATRVNRPL